MYHRIIILALLFFPFPGKTISSNFDNSLMEISNALPVQFWLVGCDTYNEHQAPGVHHKCFCAPWQCDDNIKVQFKDDTDQNFLLEIYGSNEQFLGSVEFDEILSGVYEANLNLAQDSPDICDDQVQLKIKKTAGVQGITLPDFSLWANDGGAGNPWTTGANPSINTTLIGTSSERLFVDYAFVPGATYSIAVNFTNTGGTAGTFSVTVGDSSFNAEFTESKSGASAGSNVSDVLTFTATATTTRIWISLVFAASSNTTTLNSTTASETVGSPEFVAKSDCLDVRTEHEDSVLLTYSNHRNFAGLVYEDISPANEFQIRIPATFFHQRFPEEDEVMELSTSLVTLNGTVRKQRLMDIDYSPYYFHEKMKLILKHQILEIFDRQWVKQEAYEIVEGDRRWPVKKAKVWLSEKDFVHRNIL